MSWAFWRRTKRASAPREPQPPSPALPRSAPVHDEPDEDRPATPAFSGASPQPGGSAGGAAGAHRAGPGAEPGDEPSIGDGFHAMDLRGLRVDVLDLVRAALHRERAATTSVLQRLSSRGGDEPGLAAVLAVGVLGERLVEAAGYDPDEATPGTLGAQAVIAQGDLVVGRADALLRAVAPQHPRDLARFVVRLAAGVPEAEPAVARLVEASSEELVLVASVLLAQTVLDGGGDLDRLAEQVEELLPDG